MKAVSITLFVTLLTATNAVAVGTHPIAKVIGLLEGLKAKSIAEGQAEQVSFTKFQYWCTTSSDELKDAISDEKETIAELTDKLAGLKKQKESLEDGIDSLTDQLKDLASAAREAKNDRSDGA